MLKEIIQEILEFTKSESPYRKANKGWINQDVFLDLSPSSDSFVQKNEAAKITLFWPPINNLLFNIFITIIISSVLVFTSVSFAKGRFNFDLLNTYVTKDIVKVEDNKALETNQLDDLGIKNTETEKNLQTNKLDKTNQIKKIDDTQINSDNKTIAPEIDKQQSLRKDNENNIDIKTPENKKSKSNFI